MLADDNGEEVAKLIETLPCRINLPKQLEDGFFDSEDTVAVKFNDKRRFARRRLRTKALLEIAQTLPAITRQAKRHVVFTFDISRGGLGFVHSEQLFPAERGRIRLPGHVIKFEVVRASRLGDNCYKIGCKPLG